MVACGAFVGALCDRYGNSRVFTIVRLSLAPTMLLVLVYTAPGIWTFAAVMLIGGVSVALNQTLFNFIIATLMPEESRTTGMARPTTAAGLRLGAHGHGGAGGPGRTPACGPPAPTRGRRTVRRRRSGLTVRLVGSA